MVIVMVTDDEASRVVWTGPVGALAGLSPAAVAVESSTLTPGWVRELAALGAGIKEGRIVLLIGPARSHAWETVVGAGVFARRLGEQEEPGENDVPRDASQDQDILPRIVHRSRPLAS